MTGQGFTLPVLVETCDGQHSFCKTESNLQATLDRWGEKVSRVQAYKPPTPEQPVQVSWTNGSQQTALCRSFYDLRQRVKQLMTQGYRVTLESNVQKTKAKQRPTHRLRAQSPVRV